jgi:hypothetical protein
MLPIADMDEIAEAGPIRRRIVVAWQCKRRTEPATAGPERPPWLAFTMGVSCSPICWPHCMPQTEKLDETHRTAPLNPYADSRARVEATLTRAASAGLRSVSLRYFNAAGADIGSEIGEAHEPETHLLPLAVDATLRLRDSMGRFTITVQ